MAVKLGCYTKVCQLKAFRSWERRAASNYVRRVSRLTGAATLGFTQVTFLVLTCRETEGLQPREHHGRHEWTRWRTDEWDNKEILEEDGEAAQKGERCCCWGGTTQGVLARHVIRHSCVHWKQVAMINFVWQGGGNSHGDTKEVTMLTPWPTWVKALGIGDFPVRMMNEQDEELMRGRITKKSSKKTRKQRKRGALLEEAALQAAAYAVFTADDPYADNGFLLYGYFYLSAALTTANADCTTHVSNGTIWIHEPRWWW